MNTVHQVIIVEVSEWNLVFQLYDGLLYFECVHKTVGILVVLKIPVLPETVYYIRTKKEPGVNFSWIFSALKLSGSIVGVTFSYLLLLTGFRALEGWRKRKLLFTECFPYSCSLIGTWIN